MARAGSRAVAVVALTMVVHEEADEFHDGLIVRHGLQVLHQLRHDLTKTKTKKKTANKVIFIRRQPS